jgi:Mg-chelatase subunit ChlD
MTTTTSWHFEGDFRWDAALVLIALVWAIMAYYAGKKRKAWLLSSALRTVAVVLLFLAAAGPVCRQVREAPLLVSFLLDVSNSIAPEERASFFGKINEVSSRLLAEDEGRLIVFGNEIREIDHFKGKKRFTERGYDLDGTRTNLASALRSAVLGAKREAIHRIVLLTDGNENVENAAAVAPLVRESQSQIFSFGPGKKRPESGHQPYFDRISVPQQVSTDQRFNIHVFLRNPSPNALRAVLRIRLDGQAISERRLDLPPGLTPFRLTYHEPRIGIHGIRADLEVEAEPDRRTISAVGFVHVIGKPRVILVDRDEGRRKFLAELLGEEFEVKGLHTLPAEAQELLRQECVILNDIPATEFRRNEMELLAKTVQDMGTGLVVLGGDDEDSMSSYRKTRLEDVLPVRLDLRASKSRRDFALILVIDRSGSMAGEKIEMAWRAAAKAVDSLEPGDVIGVVAFDFQPYWLVPLVVLQDNAEAVKRKIQGIAHGGGTNAQAAVKEVFRELLERQMNLRQHVVLISDGITEEEGFVNLVREMARHGITVSSVAIGQEANLPLLQRLKDAGKGEFYHVTDLGKLPKIVLEDLEESLKQVNVIRTDFRPRIYEPHPMVKGIDPADVPTLRSYCLSVLKPSGQKPLTTNFKNTEDPILATWVYGLGRSTAVLSGLRTGWLGEGTTWKQFGPLWSQIVRWTARSGSIDHALLKLRMEEDRLRVNIRVPLVEDEYPHSVKARLVEPGGAPRPILLSQKGPYAYEGETSMPSIPSTPPGQPGDWAMVIEGFRSGGPWVNAYPLHLPEPVFVEKQPVESPYERPNVNLLERLASETGGQHEPDVAQILRRGDTIEVTKQYWLLLAALAMLLVLGDIAARRLLG